MGVWKKAGGAGVLCAHSLVLNLQHSCMACCVPSSATNNMMHEATLHGFPHEQVPLAIEPDTAGGNPNTRKYFMQALKATQTWECPPC